MTVVIRQDAPELRRGFRDVTVIGLGTPPRTSAAVIREHREGWELKHPEAPAVEASTCLVCGAYIVRDADWTDSKGSVLCQGANDPHTPTVIRYTYPEEG